MTARVDGSRTIERREDLSIPVGSDTVAATRYEPIDHEGPLPALLMYVPYHKDDLITYGAYDPLNRYLAGQGYEVVVADMVGTGASSGAIDEMFVRREGREGAAIVEWLADRPWTTGRVGMFGKSYGGITALDAAAQRPDGLEAIVPIHTPYLGYRNGYTNHGLPELLTIQMNWLTYMQALDVKPPSRRDADGRWMDVWQERLESVRERTPWLLQFLDHEYKDEYWADKDIPVEDITVPTLAVGGWRDSYTQDTVEYFDAIDAPKRLLFGPWRHTMPHRGRESTIGFRRLVVDWFDRFLKDTNNDVLDGSTISYWTERNGGGKVDDGVWRGRESWPVSGSSATSDLSFAITSEGLVRTDEYDSGPVQERYRFDHTVGLESTNPYGAAIEPQDTNADDARSVCFTTDTLATPVELTGTGEARIRLRSTTSDMTLSVRVMDVAPDATARLVTEGTLRASCRDGLDSPSELTPGDEYELSVPLQPTSHVFEDGHRIRVTVAAAYFPETRPLRDHGSFTLLSDPRSPSTIRFPGRVRTSSTLDDVVEMPDLDGLLPTEPERVSDATTRWTTARERTEGVARVRLSQSRTVDPPHTSMSLSGTYEASVGEDDPLSFSSSNEQRVVMEYPSERIQVVASNRISHEFTRLTSRVVVDDEPVFEKTWMR